MHVGKEEQQKYHKALNQLPKIFKYKTESAMTSIKGLFKTIETKSKDPKAAIIAGFKQSKKILENNLTILHNLINKDLPYTQKLSMLE